MAPFAIVAPDARARARPHPRRAAPARGGLVGAGRAVLCVVHGDVHQRAGAGGAAGVPARLRRAGAREGPPDREERARARAGRQRRRAGQRQLAPRAAQRDRRDGRRAAGRGGPAAVRRRLVVAGRGGGVRGRGDPRVEDPEDAHRGARRTSVRQQLERRGDPPAEHPARGQRDGGAARQRGLPRVLRRVRAEGRPRSRSASRSSPARVGGFIGVVAAPVAATLGAGGDDRRVVAGRSRGVRAARRAVSAARRVRARRVRARRSAPPPAGSGSTACCSATAPTRCAGARSPGSRPASSSCGWSAACSGSSRSPSSWASSCSRSCSASRRCPTSRRCGRRRSGGCARSCCPTRSTARSRGRADQALGRVRRRFRKPAGATGDPPPTRPKPLTSWRRRYWSHPLVAPCTMPKGPTGQRKQSTISMSTCSRVAIPSSTHRVRLLDHRPVDAVGDEAPRAAGRVGDHHRVLPALDGDVDDRLHGRVARRASVRTISARRITTGGDAQCHPITSSGRFVTSAIWPIGNPEVFDARIVPAGAAASRSRNTCCLSSSFSGTASTTRSTARRLVERRR